MVRSLDRRSFLAWLASGAAFRPSPAPGAAEFRVQFRQPGPCAELLPLVDPSQDSFELEKQGMGIERSLRGLLEGGELPLDAGFSGLSPMPARYTEADGALIAEFDPADRGFRVGLRRWLEALGSVRRAGFHALPGGLVRYEVAAAGGGGPTYRVGHWRLVWRDGRLLAFEPIDETLVEADEPLFADATSELFGNLPSFGAQLAKGIPYWRSRMDLASGIGVYGNQGIAVGDIDADGWDEVYVCQPGGLPNRLYGRGSDGAWADLTDAAGVGVLDDTAQALFVDLRNLGRQDLVVLAASGPLLYLNDGAGRFRHSPNAFRYRTEPQGTFAGMAAADFDRDGKLDLYVCSYLYFQSEDQYRYPVPYHDAVNGPPNFLFRNRLRKDGSGYLEDATEEAGFAENNDRYSFAAAWCDYDEDGWPELYVANDFGCNNLYKFQDGRFRDIAEQAGVTDMGPGMSAAWFDYDRNGRLDLYVTNMWTAAGQRVTNDPAFGPKGKGVAHDAYHGHTKGNSLYRNAGDGTFEPVGAREGVEMGRWSWAGDAFDFDLDGTPEILVAAGMMTHAPDKDLCSFFWRRVVSQSPGEAKPAPSYETGWNCLNELIREDYSWNGNEPNVFYVRRGGRYRDASGVSGLDRALDSRAFAVTDFDGDGRPDIFLKSRLGPQLVALRNASAGRRQPLVVELVGVRSNRDAVGAIVKVETADGVSAQVLAAGSGYISQHTKRLHFGLGENAKARAVTVLWPSGERRAYHGLAAGFRYRFREGDAAYEQFPVDAPRARTLSRDVVQGRNELVFEPTWLLEPVPLPERHEAGFLCLAEGDIAARSGAAPFRVIDLRAAASHRAAAFALFRRYLFDYRTGLRLPLVFLVDDRSRVHKVYPQVPGAASMARDWEAMRQPDRDALALPFGGQYHSRPGRNHFRLGSAFMQAGYPELALPYLAETVARQPGNFKARLAVGQIHLRAGRLERAEEELGRAAELRRDSPQLWNNFGGIAMAREDFSAAAEYFGRALELNGDLPYALVNAAQAQQRLGNPVEAERLLRRALELDEADAEAANKLGLVLARGGRLEEARKLFEQAIAHQRDHAEAINNLAVLYMQSRQLGDAIAAFRYGIEQVPEAPAFYMNLARIYADTGDYASAKEVLRSLLERRPEHAAARRALTQLQAY